MSKTRLGNLAITEQSDVSAITRAHLQYQREALQLVPVDALARSPWQPRGPIDTTAEDFEALVASIAAHGVLQPVVVRELDGGALQLLAGERRLLATRRAGLTTIPARVLVGLTDASAQAVAITENLARRDLTALEEARALATLRTVRTADGLPVDVRALGAAAGRSHTLVMQLLRIADAITPAVEHTLRTKHGCDVATWLQTAPKATLLDAVSGPPDRLVEALVRSAPRNDAPPVRGPRAGLTQDDDTPATKRPAYRVQWHEDGPLRLRTEKPLAKLTKREASALLEELAPVLRALRARAKG